MVIPGAVKLTFAVRVPLGLISHTAPTAHPAKVAPVSFRNVSSGFANVKVTPVYVPGITLAVFRNAASVSNCFTSMRTGPFPPSKSTLPGLNVAPVTLTSNDRNVNPLGGVSRIVTETAELPGGGALTAPPPQPKMMRAVKRNRTDTTKRVSFIRNHSSNGIGHGC